MNQSECGWFVEGECQGPEDYCDSCVSICSEVLLDPNFEDV